MKTATTPVYVAERQALRLFITGGSGFLGRTLLTRLANEEQIEEIVAMARSSRSAERLEAMGCTVRMADLLDVKAMATAMSGCDGVLHLAADVHVGARKSQHLHMAEVNVDGTRNVLEAAAEAGCERVTVTSSINIYGNTYGAVVDESFVRSPDEEFRSAYERTKTLSQEVVRVYARQGFPVVTALPGLIYGAEKATAIGEQIRRAAAGKVPFIALGGLGLDMVYVDDVADGILRVHLNGADGEEYLLTGVKTHLRNVIMAAAHIGGKRPPRFEIPDSITKSAAFLTPLLRLLGSPPNVRESINAAVGNPTYWGDSSKAERELGYTFRSLEEGLQTTLS